MKNKALLKNQRPKKRKKNLLIKKFFYRIIISSVVLCLLLALFILYIRFQPAIENSRFFFKSSPNAYVISKKGQNSDKDHHNSRIVNDFLPNWKINIDISEGSSQISKKNKKFILQACEKYLKFGHRDELNHLSRYILRHSPFDRISISRSMVDTISIIVSKPTAIAIIKYTKKPQGSLASSSLLTNAHNNTNDASLATNLAQTKARAKVNNNKNQIRSSRLEKLAESYHYLSKNGLVYGKIDRVNIKNNSANLPIISGVFYKSNYEKLSLGSSNKILISKKTKKNLQSITNCIIIANNLNIDIKNIIYNPYQGITIFSSFLAISQKKLLESSFLKKDIYNVIEASLGHPPYKLKLKRLHTLINKFDQHQLKQIKKVQLDLDKKAIIEKYHQTADNFHGQ